MSRGEARAEARRILAERRFHGSHLPRPFHGVLSWLASHLRFVATGWDWLARHVGGAHVLWVLLGVVVVGIAVLAALRLARRRTAYEAVASGASASRAEDPRALERAAEEAERNGDLETALRLRFRAGLLRLGRTSTLPLRPSLRTREARRALRSPRFDRLADDFDEVVYGRRDPRPGDLATARAEWPHVLEEARR